MALKKKSRAQTRVCTCVSFNCGTFSFRNDLGEVQQGVELTLKAIKRHAVEDSLIHEAQNDTEKDHRNREYYSLHSNYQVARADKLLRYKGAYQSNSDSEESASDEFDELDNSELLQGHQSSQSAQSNIQLNCLPKAISNHRKMNRTLRRIVPAWVILTHLKSSLMDIGIYMTAVRA
ncbi:hypothetical protein KEM48_013583 [Puccinia striiformis f. sp. tritici PST-130]|nr:hypothetical protein KEM48_013583 [Puccinia striiformis f. sp. tritici PST-130]